ncbi:hypothetical protein ANN_15508 [Periplaneta americana]|uniref:Uncharacterized protein n=1 Tax=Periplaneta americana TaxID=6978 RepID=A0ABQ8SH96_PERAM|nr:hypothetical protein ANN_15508 [Periplaneta americana]
MVGVCKGGNEPPSSLKTNNPHLWSNGQRVWPRNQVARVRILVGAIYLVEVFQEFSLNPIRANAGKNDAETDQGEKNKLAESLAEKKLPTEGRTRRNGERGRSSWQKNISDDGPYEDIWIICGEKEKSNK